VGVAFDSTSQTSVARRRRRRRTAITLTVVGLLLVGAFLAAGAYVEGWMGHRAQASAAPPACITAPGHPELTAAQVTVNVYNSTNRSGLAASAARDLRARGFTSATVSNDPLGQAVRGTAVVRYGVSGADAARLAAAQVAGATLVRDGRADASVDVVLGAGFSALASPRGPQQDTATTGPSTTVPPGPTTPGAPPGGAATAATPAC